MSRDTLGEGLTKLRNAENAGHKRCIVRGSKLLKTVLEVMQRYGYVGEIKVIESVPKLIEVELKGKINYCKAIKPRFSVKKDEFEKYEKRYLPGSDIGILIVSTPKGIMSHLEAKKLGIGGKLLAYVY